LLLELAAGSELPTVRPIEEPSVVTVAIWLVLAS